MFSTYNELIGHLDNERGWLRHKREAWKKDPLPAIDVTREKFHTYYGATEKHQGRLYNQGIVLNSTCNLTLYNGRNWEQRYGLMYKKDFFKQFQSHYAKGSSTFPPPGASQTDLALLAQTRQQGKAAGNSNKTSKAESYIYKIQYLLSHFFSNFSSNLFSNQFIFQPANLLLSLR